MCVCVCVCVCVCLHVCECMCLCPIYFSIARFVHPYTPLYTYGTAFMLSRLTTDSHIPYDHLLPPSLKTHYLPPPPSCHMNGMSCHALSSFLFFLSMFLLLSTPVFCPIGFLFVLPAISSAHLPLSAPLSPPAV